MFYLYPSNKTENLAFMVAGIVDRHPLSDPFMPEIMLIPSQGMATWLQQEISLHTGIAALIDCKMPASFIWDLAEKLLPEQPHIPLFEKANLRWALFACLPEKLQEPHFQMIRDYLCSQHSSADEATDFQQETAYVKPLSQQILFELSAVIADVFDAYQNYRADWIAAWENGQRVFDASQPGLQALEHWQADLWCSVYPKIPVEQRQHRARLFTYLIEQLAQPCQHLKAKLPERIFIFGLSALPPNWLSLMAALGKHIDIHFMVHNPCQYYWGDVLTPVQRLKLEQALVAKGVSTDTAADTFLESNPLLASWGKLGRDYLSLLSDFPGIEEVSANLFEGLQEADSASQPRALDFLQNDILQLQHTEHIVELSDDSIRFASCHSHLREVEALHDYLFQLLDQHHDIQPRDIIVMMPEVQDFAALIDAVFCRPAYDVHGQPHYLPFGISDQRLSSDQPLLDTLSGLLSLSSARMTGADVLDWLDMPAIRSRFEIGEADREDVKQWIKQLNIRWGLSETHRDKTLRIKGSGAGNTWLKAARRLLAGYLFGEEALVNDVGNTLLACPQRSPARQVLAGKLMRFLDVVDATMRLQSKSLSLSDWLIELTALWQSWLDFELVPQDIQQVLAQFERSLAAEIACTGFQQTVCFQVVATLLNTQFEQQRVSQRFLAGKINFCTLMPMRSIPFKVVCMLGMNEGSYPRPVYQQSFDLMASTPVRTGDRSRREDDRYLFLEALCSARSHLYISYCGRDIQDNSERFPSVLVSELQRYCAEYFMLEESLRASGKSVLDIWLTAHHLQPFHPAYFYTEQGPTQIDEPVHTAKTFASDWLALINPHQSSAQVAVNMFQTELQTQPSRSSRTPTGTSAETYAIELTALQQCAGHPLRYYYNSALQVYLRDADEELQVSEPFAIKGLDAYVLKNELLQKLLTAEHRDAAFDNAVAMSFRCWQAADHLPRPPLDKFYVENLSMSLQPLYAHIAEAFSGESRDHVLDFRLGKYHVSGRLLTLGDTLVEVNLSKKPAAVFFSFWVKHVFWSLFFHEKRGSHNNRPLHDIQLTGEPSCFIGSEKEIRISVLSEEQARCAAFQLCEFFESASQQPYPFLPKTTYSLLFESQAKANSEFTGHQNHAGENQDAYWQRYCLLAESSGSVKRDIAWQYMPESEASVIFQQIQAFKDHFVSSGLTRPDTETTSNTSREAGE
jgi:exodeoxyribonuclease V gamma subunit